MSDAPRHGSGPAIATGLGLPSRAAGSAHAAAVGIQPGRQRVQIRVPANALRAEIRLLLQNYLRQLYRLGAFRGATEEQAFFVRCDETNNPAYITDAGRLIAEIGVAPAEPLEFIVLRLARNGDGTLTMKEK